MALSKEELAQYQRDYRASKDKETKAYEAYVPHDDAGKRYKSEVLSYRDLCNLYYGIKTDVKEKEDKDEGKKYRKKNLVRPAGSEILGESPDFSAWLELRNKARKDLFWLGRVLKKDLMPNTHQAVCDQFVQKNFDGVFKKGYTLADVHRSIDNQVRKDIHGEDTKEMMLMDPRGFYKSTLDGIDCVQWMLNVPDIRILILTGEYKLAVAFMKEIKEYFYLAEGSEPTDFHLLFPDYILTGVDGTSKEPIECPARKHSQKEPSLWVNSIDANLSGWHCDIRKTDDIVTDRNCNTKETREALKEKADGTDNLLDEWGFSDYIGTRYWVDDYYGTRLKPDEEDGILSPIKYFCRQCWVVKPEYIEVPLKKLEEHMVDLTFPEKATWKSLQKKLRKNERSFRNQQLNEPSEEGEDSSFKVTFLEEILRRYSYQPSAAPKEGDVFICWDWSLSANKNSDFSAGVVGKIYPIVTHNDMLGRDEIIYGISILEIVCDKWKSSELAYQIVALDKKWHPKQTLIEKSNGAELLQMEVQRNALKYGVSLNIYWKPVNQQPDAKRNRIKGLETLLDQGRLWFVLGPWIDQTYGQFVNYTGERKNRGRKDDIPDAISFFSFFLPSSENSDDRKKIEEIMIEQSKARQQYDRIFGGFGQQPNLVQPTQFEKPSLDPRSRIFGNNGLHI